MLRARRNTQRARGVNCRHINLRAQRQLREVDGHGEQQIISITLELIVFLHAHHRRDRPLPIVVAENGMCTRVRGSMRRSRPDGWRRPDFIRAHVGEMLQAVREGVPVAGYLHWSLVDNYEWGSYEPRFGLYGIDRRDGVRVMETDADGDDSAGAYRSIVDAADGRALATALRLD